MIIINKIIITGNVVRDNDVKDTAATKVLKNTLAVKREFKKDETDFVNYVAFGKTA